MFKGKIHPVGVNYINQADLSDYTGNKYKLIYVPVLDYQKKSGGATCLSADCIGLVMVTMLASSAVDRGFEP